MIKPELGKKVLIPRILSAIFIVGSLTGCNWRSHSQPSVLVIMVKNLSFGAFSCNEDGESEGSSGFQAFCDESVRFTHAYTPSTMGQAAVASILTGKYPWENGVRHNGPQWVTAQIETVSEAALKNGFGTSFFSGGPPVWRRSGLAQGFEVFDDNLFLSRSRLYRDATENIDAFLQWQLKDLKKDRYFSVLYLPDLQFTDVPTTNELGELRSSNYRGQLEEVGEAFAHLVKEMKRRKIWDNTHVMLVGLDGYATETRLDQIPSTNLFSESTRVTLMIKPARKVRDGPFNWKIDANVSLVDLGTTLFDLINGGATQRMSFETQVPSVSLVGVMSSPEPDWDEERFIISESAWTQWKGLGTHRVAARKGSFLFINDQPQILFNTLTDSLELSPLPETDERYIELRGRFVGVLNGLGYQTWTPLEQIVIDKIDLSMDLWREQKPNREVIARLKELGKRYPTDRELAGWRAIWALRMMSWKDLAELGSGPAGNELWTYVAQRNLGLSPSVPMDPCLGFLQHPRTNWRVPKTCGEDRLNDLFVWANSSNEQLIRDRAMEAFIRSYGAKMVDMRVAEENAINGMRWDIPSRRLSDVDEIDLVLALPEFHRYRSVIHRRLKLPW